MSNTFTDLARQMITSAENEMRHLLAAGDLLSPELAGMLNYHMGWVNVNFQPIRMNGGKRVRPLLCLLACLAAGGEWQQAVPAAAAVELLHNFSLIHDDIQDASPARRGRPTLWKLWGMPQAINAGDAMFAIAFLAIGRLSERGVSPEIVLEAERRFVHTCLRLTRGQHADMDFERCDAVTVEEYLAMIGGKTAALLAHSTELGALIAGRSEPMVAHYAAFGRGLGYAFQVRDDVLGIWGDEAVTGKSAATDMQTRKKSLPVLYGLARSGELRDRYAQPFVEGENVKEMVTLLDATGARQYAESQEAAYSQSALDHLEAAEPQESGYLALRYLATELLNRQA